MERRGHLFSPGVDEVIKEEAAGKNTPLASIHSAREYLIMKGICARDGSGEPNVEALFVRLGIVRQFLEAFRREIAQSGLLEESFSAPLDNLKGVLQDRISSILKWL